VMKAFQGSRNPAPRVKNTRYPTPRRSAGAGSGAARRDDAAGGSSAVSRSPPSMLQFGIFLDGGNWWVVVASAFRCVVREVESLDAFGPADDDYLLLLLIMICSLLSLFFKKEKIK
jgi:hypothetical protein